MGTTTRTVTYEEWLNMPVVEDAIEEVVNGEVRIMPPNKWKHAVIVENLSEALKGQVDRKAVRVVGSVFGLIVRKKPLTSRVPDLAVFLKQNIVERDGYIHSAPELVVEVLSPANTRRGMADKIRDNESMGVAELWIISPEAQTIEVVLLENGKLVTQGVVTQGQISPRRFPGVAVEVSSIWPD
ncbi:MAG: Uma2 family endonuclease [Acidobacteriia bacterium]|nr:Uma2 family endonuclease [Terriglobia bacterium]